MPASKGTIGDAAADEENGNIAAGGFAQEVGPDFGFEDDDEGRLDGVEDAANAEDPVEGEIDDGIGEGHVFLGQSKSGEGGGGDDQWKLGIGVFEAFGEGDGGKGFTNGDGVNPDGAGAIGGEFLEGGNGKAETLGEIREIFAVTKALDEPIGRRQQGGEAHQKAVEKVHSM